jgi:hypothetical protein
MITAFCQGRCTFGARDGRTVDRTAGSKAERSEEPQ